MGYGINIRENYVSSNASDKFYQLDALYKGIKKNESHSTKPSLPITFGLLRDICHLLRRTYFTPYTDILLAATCAMAYFGFLRCGEFTIVHSVDPNAMYEWKMCIFHKDRMLLYLKAYKAKEYTIVYFDFVCFVFTNSLVILYGVHYVIPVIL